MSHQYSVLSDVPHDLFAVRVVGIEWRSSVSEVGKAVRRPGVPVITISHRNLRKSAYIRQLATEPRGHLIRVL